MAQLNFPDNPINGQLYPNPCPPGVTQYRWESSTGIWRIVGIATDVIPGTYGNNITVGQFTVDVTGRITDAANIAIRESSISQTGVVQLNDTLTSTNPNYALTASAGKRLQDQIGNLAACTVPNHANVVEALNDLQQQSINLQENACIWCGYYNALEGDISYVSITGFRLGYRVGQELPTPSRSNGGDFFIVTTAGNPYIAGDYNAPNQFLESGNWVISEVQVWSEVQARGGKVKAIDVEYTPNFPLTANNVQNALFQITQLFRTGIGGATVSPTKPPNPYPGQLWWDNDDGLFYIYYRDSNGDQWVEASGSAGGIADGLGAGGGSVYEVKTGRGLTGGPIVTTGTINLKPAFYNTRAVSESEIGGVIPNLGFSYNNTSGFLNLKVSSDATGKDPYTAFSQEGANILNSKVSYVGGKTVLAGTYDAKNEVLISVTPAGEANGFVVGGGLPMPSTQINNFYVIVTAEGNSAKSGDWYLCACQSLPGDWIHIDYQQILSSASNIDVDPIEGIEFSGTVQSALESLQIQASNRIGTARSLSDGLVADLEKSGLFGSSLTLSLLPASTQTAGAVQLTNDITGNSESLAVTQFGLNQLNEKVNALSGGPRVLAGTYNCATGLVASVTPAGITAGFRVDEGAPLANLVPANYYLIVTVPGGFGPPSVLGMPDSGMSPGDWYLCEKNEEGSAWVSVNFNGLTAAAQNISIAPLSNLTATNIQSALKQIQDEVDEVVWNVYANGTGLTVEKQPLLGGAGTNTFIELQPASSSGLGGVAVMPGSGLTVNDSGALSLLPASSNTLGAVKVGDNLAIDDEGRLSAIVPAPLPSVRTAILDDISQNFTGRKATFVVTVDGNELPTTVNISDLFVFLDGKELRPIVDFAWDPLNSLLTFSSAPAVGTVFSARVLLFPQG